MSSVALIIIHFRTIADTLDCLESALHLASPADTAVRLIVVENGSGDGSWDRLVEWACRRKLCWHEHLNPSQLPKGIDTGLGFRFGNGSAEIILLRSNSNHGYAAGCNRGLEFALADPATTHCWVLNNDVLFDRQALDRLLHASKDRPPAIYGATMLYHEDPRAIQAAGGATYWKAVGRSRHHGKGKKVEEVSDIDPKLDYIVGAAMFFPREVVEKVGILPEHFFLYFEETEWCARARDCGFEMVWVPDARIVHKEGKSTGAGRHFRKLSDLSFRYIVRNSLLFSDRRYPLWLPSVMLFNLCVCLRYCLQGDSGKLKVFLEAVREYWSLRSSLPSY